MINIKKYKKIIILLLIITIPVAILINPLQLYWNIKAYRYRILCSNNLYQIKWSLMAYADKYQILPITLQELKKSEFAPMSPPDRFVCPKNKQLAENYQYAYTRIPINISYRGRNRKVILFCRPESHTGYFNAVCNDYRVIRGFLNNKETERLISLYDSLISKQPDKFK